MVPEPHKPQGSDGFHEASITPKGFALVLPSRLHIQEGPSRVVKKTRDTLPVADVDAQASVILSCWRRSPESIRRVDAAALYGDMFKIFTYLSFI